MGNVFSPDQILDSNLLEKLFDRDKAIFLYDTGCMRAGYLQDVLYSLGYERVYSLGGFYEYDGNYKVLGDGSFDYAKTFYNTYTSPITSFTYYLYGTYDMALNITSIRFDIIDDQGISIRTNDYDGLFDYNNELTILEDFISFDLIPFNKLFDELTSESDSKYHNIDGYSWEYTDDFINLIETMVIN